MHLKVIFIKLCSLSPYFSRTSIIYDFICFINTVFLKLWAKYLESLFDDLVTIKDAQQILMSVCRSVCLSFKLKFVHCVQICTVPECSRMFQNACRMFQNKCSRKHTEYSRMHAEYTRMNVPECIQNVLECSKMNVPECMQNAPECSRMY